MHRRNGFGEVRTSIVSPIDGRLVYMPPRTRKPQSVNTSGRAVIYARISLDKSGEGVGVERQIESCRKKAASDGY